MKERPGRAIVLWPILLGNLIPLGGVVAFGWDPALLVAVYLIEVVGGFLLAAGKALFAAQPSRPDRDGGVISVSTSSLARKRGSLEPVDWLPPIYPRNLPFASTVLIVGSLIAVVLGILTIDLPVETAVRRPEVYVGAGGLLLGQVVDTWQTYIRDRHFEEQSPYGVVETPVRQAFLLGFALLVIPPELTDPGVLLLCGFVLVKLLVDWSSLRGARGGGGRFVGWLTGPTATAADIDEPAPPEIEPIATVRADSTATSWSAVFHVLSRHAPIYASWSAIIWVLGAAIIGGSAASTGFVVAFGLAVFGLLVVVVGMRTLEYVLAYGWMEYRVSQSHIVAVDTLLDTHQWALPADQFYDADIVNRLVDRYLGTRTLELTGWDDEEVTRVVGPLDSPDVVLDTLDVPIHSSDLQPLDRRYVALALGWLGAVFGGGAIFVLSPWGTLWHLLLLILVLPVVGMVSRLCWRSESRS